MSSLLLVLASSELGIIGLYSEFELPSLDS